MQIAFLNTVIIINNILNVSKTEAMLLYLEHMLDYPTLTT